MLHQITCNSNIGCIKSKLRNSTKRDNKTHQEFHVVRNRYVGWGARDLNQITSQNMVGRIWFDRYLILQTIQERQHAQALWVIVLMIILKQHNYQSYISLWCENKIIPIGIYETSMDRSRVQWVIWAIGCNIHITSFPPTYKYWCYTLNVYCNYCLSIDELWIYLLLEL